MSCSRTQHNDAGEARTRGYSISTPNNWSRLHNDQNSENSTVKLVVSDHSKVDKEKVLKTNGSLMKNENIAENSLGAINGLKTQFLVFFLSGRLRQ